MKLRYDYHTIVIGAGAAGIVVAKGLAKAGKKVLLVEKGSYGGDCANFGCIPSKALLASANVAHEVWRSSIFGIDMEMYNFRSSRVLDRVRQVVEEVRSKYTPPVLKDLGIETVTGNSSFKDPYTIQIDGRAITAQNIVIATGTHPHIPLIAGLSDVPYHTSQTLFSMKEIPSSIAIVGGGQIGCELAQGFKRLGSSVVLIEKGDVLLKNEEPEAYKAIQSVLIKEGVEIYLAHELSSVHRDGDKNVLTVKNRAGDRTYEFRVQELMIACGREPNLKELNLEEAGITYSEKGIDHDAYGRCSRSHIWVVGDVSGDSLFTHSAANNARRVLMNILLPALFMRKMDSKQAIPRTISCDPEVASIGLTEKEAIEQYGNKKIIAYYVPLSEADRAICEARSDGFVKIVAKRLSGKILGATIVSPIGADMVLEISCAMRDGANLRKISDLIHPYPTYSQIIQKAADMWLSDTLLPLIGKWFR